jgi:murein DD-endopeptidase MepM/ murein hydrolase activator NlpD
MAYRKLFSIGLSLIWIPFIFFVLGLSGKNKKEPVYATDINQNILITNPETRFGIVTDSFHIESGRIRWSQNLAGILNRYDLGEYSVHQIAREIDRVFDVTRFRAGRPYYFFLDKYDTTGRRVSYFVYENTPKEYVKVNLQGGVNARKLEREIRLERKVCAGTIENSLWATMQKNDVKPTLALELSEVYAWSINFFRLTEGDRFRVIYDEEYVDSTSVGIHKIHTACFVHKGGKYYAIPFVQDSTRDFYDLEGNSLRRQFLKAPLRFSRISSGYSLSRMHPILNYRRPHRGVDYAAPAGTPIHAIGDGVVIDKGYTRGAGYYIKIRHNSIYVTGYNHLSRYARGMREGQRVNQGQTIGYVGSTGYSTGPHLDFRFWKNGHPVNPLKVEAPPVEPIKAKNRKEFTQIKQQCLKELKNIPNDPSPSAGYKDQKRPSPDREG